jgi:hypothetical protein
MRRLLGPLAGLATVLAGPAQASGPAPPSTWTGFYLGANAGP